MTGRRAWGRVISALAVFAIGLYLAAAVGAPGLAWGSGFVVPAGELKTLAGAVSAVPASGLEPLAGVPVSVWAAGGADYVVKKFIVNAGDTRNPFSENAYVLSDPATGDAVLIDPGAADPRIAAYVAQKKLVVRKILYTHAHDDHVGGGRHFADLYRVKIAGPRADAELFTPAENRPEEWLEGDSTAVFGSLTVLVIATPGHTPGSVCFLAGDNLLSGDTLFKGSIGKPYGNSEGERSTRQEELVAGIRRKLLSLPVTTWVYPGHGPSTTIMDEEAGNPFLKPKK